jgi:hypothetical protein
MGVAVGSDVGVNNGILVGVGKGVAVATDIITGSLVGTAANSSEVQAVSKKTLTKIIPVIVNSFEDKMFMISFVERSIDIQCCRRTASLYSIQPITKDHIGGND